MSGIRGRWNWVGRPWFLACCVVLLLNDHWWKPAAPSPLTGKLSDLVGPVVVGVPMAVLLGRRTGLLLTGVAFLALKTLPGVAELAAPVLGGVTQRDPTDLVGLISVALVWLALGHTPDARSRGEQRRRVAGGLALLTPWVGLTVAVVGTSATSACPPTSAVDRVMVVDGALYAASYDVWARSDDLGATWRAVPIEKVPGVTPTRPSPRATTPTVSRWTGVPSTTSTVASPSVTATGSPSPISTDQVEACRDGLCLRYEPTAIRIERYDQGWILEYARAQDDTFEGAGGRCASQYVRGVSLQVYPDGSPVRATVNVGSYGLLIRDESGKWTRRGIGVFGIGAPMPWPDLRPLGIAIFGIPLVFAAVVGVVCLILWLALRPARKESTRAEFFDRSGVQGRPPD